MLKPKLEEKLVELLEEYSPEWEKVTLSTFRNPQFSHGELTKLYKFLMNPKTKKVKFDMKSLTEKLKKQYPELNVIPDAILKEALNDYLFEMGGGFKRPQAAPLKLYTAVIHYKLHN